MKDTMPSMDAQIRRAAARDALAARLVAEMTPARAATFGDHSGNREWVAAEVAKVPARSRPGVCGVMAAIGCLLY